MHKSLYFVILLFGTYVITIVSRIILNIDNTIYESLSETISHNQIEEILTVKDKWQWITYLIIPVILFLKIILVSTALFLGAFFVDKKIRSLKLWLIVIKAEFIFLLAGIFKLLWFYFFKMDFSFEDIQYFYPLSALNIVGYEGLDPWFIYPLQVLNLFELAYWFLLAYLLGKELNISMDKGFKIVASSYGPALLIWVVAVMFFTLNYS